MILTLIHKTCIIREYISDTPLSRLSNATQVQFLPKMAKAFNINSWSVREDFNKAKLKLEIPNLLWAGKGDRIGSKLFLVGRSKFRLDVYPSGCDSAEQGMLSAFLHNASNHDVVVDYTMAAEGIESISSTNLKIVPGVGKGCRNFMKAKEVGAALNITVGVTLKWEDISGDGEMMEENHGNSSDLVKVEERLKQEMKNSEERLKQNMQQEMKLVVRAEIAKLKTSSIPECPVCFENLAHPKKIVQCLKVALQFVLRHIFPF